MINEIRHGVMDQTLRHGLIRVHRLVLVLTLAWPLGASCEFESGVKAYGRGDFEQAAEEWRQPAALGNADSQYRLAGLYETGMGVPRNWKTAIRWYRKAANSDHVNAQFRLGFLFERGRGLPRDIPKAVAWYLAAADNEHPVARARIGNYFEGRKDYVQAYLWYQAAVDSGHEFVDKLIPAVSDKLTSRERQQADSGLIELRREIGGR